MTAEIKVDLIAPPIPVRCFDWCAWRDGSLEDGPRGWGASSWEAIADLLEREKDADEPKWLNEDGPGSETCRADAEAERAREAKAGRSAAPAQTLPEEPK